MFDSAPTTKRFSEILGDLETFVASLQAEAYTADGAKALIKQVIRAEKLCGNAKLIMGRRLTKPVAEGDGHTSPADWMAAASGDSTGRERRDLETARKLETQPELEQAVRSGEVSPVQASLIASALDADPDAARQLLDTAKSESLNVLRDSVRRVIAAKTAEEDAIDRAARIRARRHLRFGVTDDGAVTFRGELPAVEGAALKNAVQLRKQQIFREAAKSGTWEPHEAYMADALAALCREASGATNVQPSGQPSEDSRPEEEGATRRPEPPARPGTPRTEIVLHVSVEALRRGELVPGEICEIAGVGPVPLATVEYLFGNAFATIMVKRGVNVVSVTRAGRFIPAHIDSALRARDPVCAVPGCGIAFGLERDHIIPIEEHGPTELDNLVRLCHRHHYLKTHKYFRLVGKPGAWQWINIRPEPDDGFDSARRSVGCGLRSVSIRIEEPTSAPGDGLSPPRRGPVARRGGGTVRRSARGPARSSPAPGSSRRGPRASRSRWSRNTASRSRPVGGIGARSPGSRRSRTPSDVAAGGAPLARAG